jgi:hypothetical protein
MRSLAAASGQRFAAQELTEQVFQREQLLADFKHAVTTADAGQPLHVVVQQRQAVDVPAIAAEPAPAPTQGFGPLRQVPQEGQSQFCALGVSLSVHARLVPQERKL